MGDSDYLNIALSVYCFYDNQELSSFEEATDEPNAHKWIEAMNKEIESLNFGSNYSP